MKAVTKQEAVQGFDMIGGLAHAGQTVVVTSGGKPWIKPGPALPVKPGKSAAAFKARLTRISPAPIPGASGVLSRLRGLRRANRAQAGSRRLHDQADYWGFGESGPFEA